MMHTRFAAFAVVAALCAAIPLSGQETTTPPAGEAPVLVVRPSGQYLDLPEQGADLTALLMGGGGKPKAFFDLIDRIDEAAASSSTDVLFDLSGTFALNAAQVTEVDRAINRLRKAGKKTWAYLENSGSVQFQVATQCERVLMANLGTVDMPAPALGVTFLKDALDLLGVQFDVVRCGDFKGAVEPYVLPQMSTHLRQHYLAMLDSMNAAIVDRISRGRNIPSTQVREMQSARLFTARKARDAGLVDELVGWIGAKAAFETVTGRKDVAYESALKDKKATKNINILALLSQIVNPREESEDDEVATIGVLHLSGAIVDGSSAAPGSIVSGPTVTEIKKLAESANVKGVVVRINSPGGSATASEAILLALRDLSAKKPVVVSMGSMAASGGYYVTCIGRPIFAEEGTLTGSIGVFGMKPNVGALMRRVGVHSEIVALDESAGMMSLDRGWTETERTQMQGFVNEIYDVFIGHVARSRGKTTSEILAIAGGRVWSGAQAVELGLVDRIGGLGDAVALIAKEAKIDDFELRHVPRAKSFFETIASEMMDVRALLPAGLARTLARDLDLDRALSVLLDALTNEHPTQVWALAPEAIRLR